MACPNCNSENFKRGEEGLLLNVYICKDCDTVYERLTPNAQKMALVLGLAIMVGPAGKSYIIHDR